MKRKILLGIIGVLVLTGCTTSAIEKDFEKGLNKFVESDISDSQYEIKIQDKKMIVNYNSEEYVLTYNLEDNPTITYEFDVKKGISYDDYLVKSDGVSLPALGYVAIADTYGVDVVDSYTYFSNKFLEGMFNSIDEDGETYIVVDDKEGYEGDAKIILTEEFPDKVLEFVETSYKNAVKIEDEENDTFTYQLSAKCKEDTCTITSNITINSEGNFDKLKGYADELAKENMDESITVETADYHLELVVGQTAIINGSNGYDISGMDVVDVNLEDDSMTFKAIKAGVANGNFYVGEEDTKTFYITVKEASNDSKVEDINITVE